MVPLMAAGCSSSQSFSEVAGNVRVRGEIRQNVLEPQRRTLSVNLSNAQTGRPVDAMDVELKAGSSHTIHPMHERKGSYSASFADTDRVELLIVTSNRAAVIALQRQ
jgi:hypothetical protein